MATGIKSLLISLTAILFASSLFAYTIVLKNGKKVEGSLLHQDSEIYQLRDAMGIIITIKRPQIDVEATNKQNEEEKQSKPISTSAEHVQSEPKVHEVSVADLAREARQKKTGTARILRKEDLEKMPELSVIGTEESEEQAPEPKSVDETGEKTEEYWKGETRKFAIALRKAKDDSELFSKECEDLGKQAAYAITDPSRYILVNGVLIPIAGSGYDSSVIQRAQEVCFQAEQAKKQLQRLEKELEEFQEYARRQGALPGWIDPDRLP